MGSYVSSCVLASPASRHIHRGLHAANTWGDEKSYTGKQFFKALFTSLSSLLNMSVNLVSDVLHEKEAITTKVPLLVAIPILVPLLFLSLSFFSVHCFLSQRSLSSIFTASLRFLLSTSSLAMFLYSLIIPSSAYCMFRSLTFLNLWSLPHSHLSHTYPSRFSFFILLFLLCFSPPSVYHPIPSLPLTSCSLPWSWSSLPPPGE